MSHTPGPWTDEAGHILSEDGLSIASVMGGDGLRFIEDDQNAECAANAKLIASAPDLLSALQFYAFPEGWEEDMGVKAREAIRKAIG